MTEPSEGSGQPEIPIRRSTLVVAADRGRMVEKSATLPTDVVMLDMEDAVVYTDHAKAEARATVLAAMRSVDFSGKEVIVYCHIGERSSHTWFVLQSLLGYGHVLHYDGSWTEWGSLIGAPIEK